MSLFFNKVAFKIVGSMGIVVLLRHGGSLRHPMNYKKNLRSRSLLTFRGTQSKHGSPGTDQRYLLHGYV